MLSEMEFTIFPETDMAYRLPIGSRIVGISHDRPYPKLKVEGKFGAPEEMRVFRAVTPTDVGTFDSFGWQHRSTSLIGGEEPGEMWFTIHIWELTSEDELDRFEIERQLLDRP